MQAIFVIIALAAISSLIVIAVGSINGTRREDDKSKETWTPNYSQDVLETFADREEFLKQI